MPRTTFLGRSIVCSYLSIGKQLSSALSSLASPSSHCNECRQTGLDSICCWGCFLGISPWFRQLQPYWPLRNTKFPTQILQSIAILPALLSSWVLGLTQIRSGVRKVSKRLSILKMPVESGRTILSSSAKPSGMRACRKNARSTWAPLLEEWKTPIEAILRCSRR